MAKLPYIAYTERMVGSGHPSLPDTLNRGLRALLSQSGYDPDASPFPGLRGPVFNVKAFGALGDGVTDDTASIMAAVAGSSSDASRVQAVVFPPGGYKISSTILLPTNSYLLGIGGRWSSFLQLAAGANTTLIANKDASNAYIQIENLLFDGNKANQTVAAPAIQFTKTSYSTLRDVRISNVKGEGFKAQGGVGSGPFYLFGVQCSGCSSHGFTFLDSSDCYLFGLECDLNGGHGFNITGSGDNLRFINCHSESSTLDGWFIGQNACFFGSCRALNNQNHGFEVNNVQDNILWGVKAENNGQAAAGAYDGIVLIGGGANNNIIVGSRCLDRRGGAATQRYGINLFGPGGNSATGNLCAPNQTGAINDATLANTLLGNQYSVNGPSHGRAVLVGGTIVVSASEVQTNDIIQLTRVLVGGTLGHLSVGAVVAGTSFVINSSSGADTSTVAWSILH